MFTPTILGSGISALLTSLYLSRNLIQSQIIGPCEVSSDIRNIAITHHSVNILKTFGIWTKISGFACEVKDIYVLDNKSPQYLHFDHNCHINGSLCYMIPYAKLHEVLMDIVVNDHNIEFIDSFYQEVLSMRPDLAKVILTNGKEIDSSLVIVCDGMQSKARNAFFESLVIKDYLENALVCNIRHSNMHENTAIEHFVASGPSFAVLPLKDQYESSIVWCHERTISNIYKNMSIQNLEAHLLDMMSEYLGSVEVISKISIYPIYGYLASKYYYNNIVLVADSAHSIHPLAGQGLNQGIKDIHSLINNINLSLEVGILPNIHTFNAYQKERFLDNAIMFSTMNIFDIVFRSNKFKEIRQSCIGLFNRFELKKGFIR